MVVVLVGANLLVHLVPGLEFQGAVPLAAVTALLFAHLAGLTWHELGLGHDTLATGARWGLVCGGAIVGVLLVAAVLPLTRQAFGDNRYDNSVGEALLLSLVLIPLITVIPEELAFRGVIFGLVRHRHGMVAATTVSSVLFGLWHVLGARALAGENDALGDIVGTGSTGSWLGVAGAVLFTALAGVVLCWLRERSDSLLAPIGLHWAANGAASLVVALVAAAGLA